MNTMEAITSRKSVRSYTGESINEEEKKLILKAANAAPAGMGRYENVHLTVIDDKEILKEIDKAAGKMMGDPSRHALYGAPLLILVSAKIVPGMENAGYSNAAVIVQNMSLEAVELGIGTCHIWGAVNAVNGNPDLIRKLRIPEGFTPCCGITLGKTNESYVEREIPEDRIQTDYLA